MQLSANRFSSFFHRFGEFGCPVVAWQRLEDLRTVVGNCNNKTRLFDVAWMNNVIVIRHQPFRKENRLNTCRFGTAFDDKLIWLHIFRHDNRHQLTRKCRAFVCEYIGFRGIEPIIKRTARLIRWMTSVRCSVVMQFGAQAYVRSKMKTHKPQ